ncbi:MAG: regulatory protein RecX [Gemmatimonadota bacterium]|nr:regulatory protein RecX [Gemmatimonadota bacterium]
MAETSPYITISSKDFGMSSESNPLITRIQSLRPRGLKVLIHTDCDEPFEVTLEALERNRLGVGDPLPEAHRHLLLNDDADVRVREAALNLLSYRMRTRSELKRRLRQKDFRPARIDLCLDQLEAKGFLNDEAAAAAFIRDRLRHRPRGKARLSSELRSKGLDADITNRVINDVFENEGTDDLLLARQVAEGWLRRQNQDTVETLADTAHSQSREKVRRRLYGHLTRRGFRGDALRTAIEETIEAARN